jgi:hypothetical protein
LPPAAAISGLEQFSAESKNELIRRLARTFDPPPRGRLLGRLAMIMNEENKAELERLYIANLRSPYPQARKASLYGLANLNYAGLIDLAILSLRDDSDQVLAAACDLLLPKARQDPQLWKILQEVYALHKGKPGFHATVSLLQAHGMGEEE